MKFRNPTLKSFWYEVPWGLLGIKSCKVSKKLIFLSCRFLVPSAHSPYERGGIFLLQQHLVALCRWVFESAQLLQLWSGVRFSLWFWHGFNFCQLPTSPGLFFPTAPRTTRLSNHSSLPPVSSHLPQVCQEHGATRGQATPWDRKWKMSWRELWVFAPLNPTPFLEPELCFLTDFPEFVHSKALKALD